MTSRLRLFVAALAVGAAALPAGLASADHCLSRILLLSGTGFVLDTGSTACPATEEDANMDIVNPGSTSMLVRFQNPDKPVGPSTLSFSGITSGSRAGCAPSGGTVVCTITWTQALNSAGQPLPGVWESAFYSVNRNSSVIGGEAVVSVCVDAEQTDCESRTYRTVSHWQP